MSKILSPLPYNDTMEFRADDWLAVRPMKHAIAGRVLWGLTRGESRGVEFMGLPRPLTSVIANVLISMLKWILN